MKQDGIVSWSKKSSFIDKIYKSELTLDASPQAALTMVSPLKEHRAQWDPFLEGLNIIKSINPVRFFGFFAN